MSEVLEMGRLAVLRDEAQRDYDDLARRFGNVLFPQSDPVIVRHSLKQDGGDASRRGSFHLYLDGPEIEALMASRLAKAKERLNSLTVALAAEQAKYMRVSTS
jgi:hypothetical protein